MHLRRELRARPRARRLDVVRVRERPAVVPPAPREPRRPDREEQHGRDHVLAITKPGDARLRGPDGSNPTDDPRDHARREIRHHEQRGDHHAFRSRHRGQCECDRRSPQRLGSVVRLHEAIDRDREQHREQLGLEPTGRPARKSCRAREQERRHDRPGSATSERALGDPKHHVERHECAHGPEHA